MKSAMLFAAALLLAAGAGVEPPRIGCMIDKGGHARIVYGVAGTFLLGDEGSDCAIELRSEDRHWTTRRENGRWWLIQVDRESGGETERVPLDERAEFAVAFGGGAAVTSLGNSVEYRGQQWELPSAVVGLHRMSSDWIQIATSGASYALRPAAGERPYLLPGGDSK